MKTAITFEYLGSRYTVSSKAYDLDRIVLPDGRMLEAESWLELNPPQPQDLHEVSHTFKSLEPEKIAELMNAVVATETIAHFCECESFDCNKKIELPLDVAMEISRNGHIVIVDGCKNGANPTDTLVEKGIGYSIYRE